MKKSELGLLLDLVPVRWRDEIGDREGLTEIVLDLGRPLEVRYGKKKVFTDDQFEVTEDDLESAVAILGTFGPDNRAGIDRTLHRVSRILDRNGNLVGLTCRIGKPILGCVKIIEDLVESGESILILGAPGTGKTTKLRDVCRFASVDLDRSVVIVDTSNEIAGDGRIVHSAVGRARRLQVPNDRTQHAVMQEAVENHTPEVLVIDEIGNKEEAEACRTFAQRGVQLIATAHGNTLEDVVNNPALRDLIGGIKTVTLSDETARQRGQQKTQQERASEPTFTLLVEIIDYNTVAVHRTVGQAVDILLQGGTVQPEVRVIENGEWDIIEPARAQLPQRQRPTKTERKQFRPNQQNYRGRRRR